jgi:UTP--glucose-1-phosphate uridylyltransferase
MVVRKAVFPVAGLGTRFLPATKAMPKEMLPIVDKPLIQYAVEEAAAAGIEQFIFVTGRGKTAIEDHFDRCFELEALLEERQKQVELAYLQSMVLKPGCISYTRQQVPLGLGHAVWCARHLIKDEPFAVLLADDLIYGGDPCLKEMVDLYAAIGGHLVAVMEVPETHVQRYGIIDVEQDQGRLIKGKGVVEKPQPGQAPSRLAVIGRYILDSTIFNVLETQSKGTGGEIQLTDALAAMIGTVPFHGMRFSGRRYDCGSKAGFMAASLAVALDRHDIREELLQEFPALLTAGISNLITQESLAL